MTLQAKRYAQALHSAAVAAGAADAVLADLQALQQVISSPAARALLTSPDITTAERAAVLEKVARGHHTLVANLLGVLQQRHRLEVLFDVHPAYRALLMAARGEVEGVVESAHPLGADEVGSLEALAGRLSGKKVKLTVVTRADVLGGVRLRIGNVLYDGSLQSQLGQLAQKLAQAAV
ncbi:MAG: ATP synthase F1 subunit delta [Planctomycetes bacterium]|nr:ATP synthase F1 subunit delta [Planctomycetota bacterium]